jgi:hypothetical protein
MADTWDDDNKQNLIPDGGDYRSDSRDRSCRRPIHSRYRGAAQHAPRESSNEHIFNLGESYSRPSTN